MRKRLWKYGEMCEGSGRIVNPGKQYVLRLAANAVCEVNFKIYWKGISYAHKAMVVTHMSLSYNISGRKLN